MQKYIIYGCSTIDMAQRKFSTYHSSYRAIVKCKRKMPDFMTLEYACIFFVENNIKKTWKTV